MIGSVQLLPALSEHRCSVGERGGFFQRLERGTYLAHILEHVVLELQNLAGTEVGFGKTRMTSIDGVYRVAIEYQFEELALAALEAGRALCLAVVHDRPFDVAAAVEQLRVTARARRPAPVVAALLDAARRRSIPVRLHAPSLIQLGHGARQRRILDGQTDRCSAVGNSIAYDRELTRCMLQAMGIPVPCARPSTSREDAWAAAEEVGLPVILRPRYASGQGTATAALNSRDEVAAAYQQADAEGWSPLVEHAAPGDLHRLLVIGRRVMGTARQTAAGLVDVTSLVHPTVAERAVEAAVVLGLEVAGVELIASDIGKPLEDQEGIVVGVAGQPDLQLGPDADATAEALLALLYPDTRQSRIPIVAVTGTNGKTTTTRLAGHLLGQAYGPVGMTCTEGIYIGRRRIMTGDCSGPKSARVALQHPEPRAAVLEVARGGIVREGLGFDRCHVAIVTNIGDGDHLGSADIETPEQLAWVKSTLVWAVAPHGYAVLNAADPLVVAMAKYCDGQVIYFARQEQNPVLAAHRVTGGRAVFVRDNRVIFAEGDREIALVSLAKAPLTHGGRVGFHVENTLAAASAAWACGIPPETIAAGLETFTPDMEHVPARFNLLDVHGVTVVLDYGHNTSALASLLDVLGQFPHERRAVVYSAAGDRRDSDIVQQGEQLGGAFDRVFLYEDTYLRGRKAGEISELFRQGMVGAERVKEVHEIPGGMAAIEAALAASQPGDLLVIQPDRIDDGVALLRKSLEQGGREINLDEALRRPQPATEVGTETPVARIEIRKNHLGNAVYAAHAFTKGDFILRGWGPTTTERSKYTIQVDNDLHMTPPIPMRYLNHSCSPNCGLLIRTGVEDIEIHALRPIAAGEELTLDYETFEVEFQGLTGPCLCGSPSCRGTLVGYSGLSPGLRKAYGVYIAEYLHDETDMPVVHKVTADVQ